MVGIYREVVYTHHGRRAYTQGGTHPGMYTPRERYTQGGTHLGRGTHREVYTGRYTHP